MSKNDVAKRGYASVSMQRVSSRKALLVANLIREKSISQALSILKNTNKKVAPILVKLLNSAIANAVNNNGLNAEKLFVSQIFVEQGPTLKRFQPRAKGTAYSILKRTSSFKVEVRER